ncbi:MAG: hypothetical protein PHU27_05800 [Salinivirgaceae bacterium]|nr:hypothetical protein [Salinivirgaceae bacterium]MDD4747349.1 hypothetical protein [Salinivirgaceae bacterium]MDY0281915.1 hypothetical protein [Salinivirgaceae bacterium]
MLIRLFKGVLPSKLFLAVLISIVGWLPFFIWETPAEQKFTMEFISNFFVWANLQWCYVTHVTIFLLASVLSIYLVQFNFKYIVIDERTYLPASILILLSIFISKTPNAINILVLSIIWLMCYDILYAQAGFKISVKSMFNAGLLLAIGSLFIWQSIFLIPLIWALSFISNNFNIRGVLSIIVGFFTFWLLLFYGMFYFDIFNEFTENILAQIAWKKQYIGFSILEQIPLLLASVLILIGFLATLIGLSNKKIITRKYYSTFYLSVLLITILTVSIPQIPLEYFFLTTIPLTFVAANYLLQTRLKWIPNIIFALFFMGIALFWIL